MSGSSQHQDGLGEGIHLGIPEARYHGDPCAEPSVSSGLLRLIGTRSAEHARCAHPGLNSAWQPRAGTPAMQRGTILHALTLGTPAPYRVIPVSDFRTAAAKALRDDALRAGLIPIKPEEECELLDVAASLRARLLRMPEVWRALADAVSTAMIEVTLIWRERGVLCRCRYDTLPAAAFGVTYDLKFTGLSAEPDAAGKTVTSDYLYQADFYPRAVRALRGDSPEFVFLAVETEEPYGASLHALAPGAAAAAREDVDEALDLWRGCLRDGNWPGYAPLVHYHDLPIWAERQRAERMMAREQIKMIGGC